jgi:ribosomal protein S6--L-glutamate ligase
LNAPFRLGILGNPDGWYVRDLGRAAQKLGHIELDALSFRDLQVQSQADGELQIHTNSPSHRIAEECEMEGELPIESSSPSPRFTGERGMGGEGPMQPETDCIANSETVSTPVLIRLDQSFDALLVRTMPLGSLEQVIFRMNALHVARQRGLPIVNAPRALEIAIDKWLTLDFARQSGLDVPRTICCQTRDAALEAFEELDRDVVVKPLFGGEGRGIVRINDPDIAWRVFSTLEQIAAVIYLQEFIPHHGFDIRILLIGDDAFCVARHSIDDGWRTNLSRGGKATRFQPTEHQLSMARAAAKAIGGEIVGVDILQRKDGRDVLIEVNAVPGWRGTARALDKDISAHVLQYLQSRP